MPPRSLLTFQYTLLCFCLKQNLKFQVFFCCPNMGMGFVLKSGWATHDLELKENWLTFSHQLSGTNISLVRKSSILLLPPCWDICQSLFFFQDKWCNLICAFVLLGLENSFFSFIHHSGCFNLSTHSFLVALRLVGMGVM